VTGHILSGHALAASGAGIRVLAARGVSEPALTTPALWLTSVERSLMLMGLALALGGLAGRGVARQYKGTRPVPLPAPWAIRGCLLGLAASCALLITAAAGPGIAARLAQPHPAGLPTGGTAEIAATEAVLFALAAVLLRVRQQSWAIVGLFGVVLAEAIRSHPEAMIPVAGAFVTCCHLLPAVVWAGMLVYAVRAGLAWRGHPSAMQGIIRLYASAAAWLFGVVLVTGFISVLVVMPLGSLLTTEYGAFLIAKAVLVAIAASLALSGRLWLRRSARPGAGPALATRLEVAALAAVLLVTGILTVLTPPGKPVTAQPGPSGPPAAAAPHWPGSPAAPAGHRRSELTAAPRW